MLVILTNADCPAPQTVRPWHHLAARVYASRLDRALAAGACPDDSVALSLRARQLARTPLRRELAGSVQRVLAAAGLAPAGRLADRGGLGGQLRLPVPVCRDRVRDCAADFGELTGALLTAGPVSPRGLAQARMLLCDATGPLYHRASADDLRARVRSAVRQLSPLGDSAAAEHSAASHSAASHSAAPDGAAGEQYR